MLNNLFINIVMVCGAVIAVVAAVCALKAGFLYLFPSPKAVKLPDEPVKAAEEVTYTVSPINTNATIRVEQVQKQDSVVAAPILDLQPTTPEPEPYEPIECGACGKEIRSGYVAINKTPPSGAEMLIFECEHCRTKVAVPAD